MNVEALLIALFERLAERLNSENDLSDLTWALAETIPSFGVQTLRFLNVAADEGAALRFNREVNIGNGCRVDFCLPMEGGRVLIESKLDDRNYHFKDYADQIAGDEQARLILLANHSLDASALRLAARHGWRTAQWRDLIAYLGKQDFGEAAPLVSVYLEYARKVCRMVDIQPIRFESQSLYSLVSFNALIDEIIRSASHDEFSYKLYDTKRNFGPGWSRLYYDVKHPAPTCGRTLA